MSALPAFYLVGKVLRKNGLDAYDCVKSTALKCVNEPPLPVDCTDKEWQFIRTYVPLVHGDKQIKIHHEVQDRFVALETIDQLAERPASATHVVIMLPMRIRMVPIKYGDKEFLNPVPLAIKSPLFFYAQRRDADTADDRLELFVDPKT